MNSLFEIDDKAWTYFVTADYVKPSNQMEQVTFSDNSSILFFPSVR